jgi:hypothetical protein
MAVVYRHIRKDTDKPFYIGIGSSINRAYQKRSRNSHWKNIVSKTDYEVEILFDDLTYEQAKEKEIEFIKLYGRNDIGTGILCNMTDGGDGNNNFSVETKEKISKSLRGKTQSEETKAKRIATLKETWKSEELRELKRIQSKELNRLGLIGNKGMVSSRKGVKFTQEQKNKLSHSLKEYYKTHSSRNKKKFTELELSIIIDGYKNKESILSISKKLNVSRNAIYTVINENFKKGS